MVRITFALAAVASIAPAALAAPTYGADAVPTGVADGNSWNGWWYGKNWNNWWNNAPSTVSWTYSRHHHHRPTRSSSIVAPTASISVTSVAPSSSEAASVTFSSSSEAAPSSSEAAPSSTEAASSEAAPSSTEVASTSEAAPSSTEVPAPSSSASSAAVRPTFSTSRAVPTTSSAAPKPTTSSAAPATTAAPGGSSLTADQQSWLDLHNAVRSQHGANALTYSTDLEASARAWGQQCKWEHSKGKYGENLFAGSGTGWTPKSAVDGWAAEVKDYNPASPMYSHFTQIVWKATTKVGCATVVCDNLVAGWGKSTFSICQYDPAGNVLGQFPQNVQV